MLTLQRAISKKKYIVYGAIVGSELCVLWGGPESVNAGREGRKGREFIFNHKIQFDIRMISWDINFHLTLIPKSLWFQCFYKIWVLHQRPQLWKLSVCNPSPALTRSWADFFFFFWWGRDMSSPCLFCLVPGVSWACFEEIHLVCWHRSDIDRQQCGD